MVAHFFLPLPTARADQMRELRSLMELQRQTQKNHMPKLRKQNTNNQPPETLPPSNPPSKPQEDNSLELARATCYFPRQQGESDWSDLK